MVMALSLCENSGADIYSNRNLFDSEYANDVVLLSKDPSKLQVFLDRPNDSIGTFWIYLHSRSVKCFWRTEVTRSQTSFARGELGGTDRFSC